MNRNIKLLINNLYELGKVKITFFVAISGSVGYILANGNFDFNLLIAATGILILSIGSAAFNHIQEIKTDSLMNRTMNRPLPANKMSKNDAILWASIFVLIGLGILFLNFGFDTFTLGLVALAAYNLFYTPLKKITAFAIFPGAIVGALPPAIGWVAGGGDLLDPKIFALGLFFFIWQIPHFWFLMLIFDKDYRQAGFPTPSAYLSEEQLKRITYVWVVALAATCMLIPFFGVTQSIITNVMLLLAGFVLVWRTRTLVITYDKKLNLKLAFLDINLYVLAVVLLLSVDKFI